MSFPPPKPITDIWRPELTGLPRLTHARRFFRAFAKGWMKSLCFLCLRVSVEGMEKFPRQGPAVAVVNHLGDADAALLLSELPMAADALGKVELYFFPVLGRIMDWYGFIWLHRGQPDRRALHAALQGLAEGRVLVLAPEGRYTLAGGLEQGGPGAAFLALKADVPVVPVALTGTQNAHVYGSLRRLRRASVTMTVGEPFRLEALADRRAALREGTQRIMESLARLLPPGYRGAYE